MCYQDRKSKHQLPTSFYHELNNYYSIIQELVLIGGEPLVIRNIRRLMKEFPTEDCPDTKLALITNGTIFDADTMAMAARVPLS
jgi:organic radical activating enzyme